MDASLPEEGGWPLVGINDLTLAQTATNLSQGTLWIEGMSQSDACQIPIAKMRDFIDRVGPHHLDLCGAQVKSDGLPQGPFERHDGSPPGTAYPTLWSHDAPRERSLVVSPDSHCTLRRVGSSVPEAIQQRAEQRWNTASRSHYNLDLQFNSQSLCVATTPTGTIGGRAWPTVVFSNNEFVPLYALWCNSTLGILCHWWTANKTQSGRGCHTVTSVPLIPALDLRQVTPEQLSTAASILDEVGSHRFLPWDQIDEDPAREELDRRVLIEVLGLPDSLCQPNGAMDRLRRKLSAEPQIHGGKATRVVFTQDGETSARRNDR